MENQFRKVVEHIFNNWTALKLAVEHSMAGPESSKVALDFINYIVEYCLYESSVDVDSIQEALDDIMDQEFETVCEDCSTKEIAIILNKFLLLLKEGTSAEFENEYGKLPVSPGWLVSKPQTVLQKETESKTGESEAEVPMDEDSEWTTVKSRRK